MKCSKLQVLHETFISGEGEGEEMQLPDQVRAPSLGLLHQWLHSLLHLLHSHSIELQLLQSPEL